ncbi:MAG TPA: hypothetical protein VM818_15240 [Vicinamibacterales bacterium]|nr:hypothetical protein [Vicinamibacterales bacterium]
MSRSICPDTAVTPALARSGGMSRQGESVRPVRHSSMALGFQTSPSGSGGDDASRQSPSDVEGAVRNVRPTDPSVNPPTASRSPAMLTT